ncbi:MAG: DNA polymerase III subunit alpha, partial [Armatimonadota bacterium]
MPTPFVHLHNHSEFSLLDGATKIKDMVKYAVDRDMPAIGLTDHGMMYGSFEFYKTCKAAGIKPLVGCCLPGQLIHTQTGVKPIEEIEVGELVLTHEGVYRPVLSTMTRRYTGTIYGVKAAMAETVWLTDEHPVLVKEHGKDDLQWIRADSLHAGKHAQGRRGASNWKSYAAFPRLRDDKRELVHTLYLSDYLDKNLYGVEGEYIHKTGKFNKYDRTIAFTIPHKIPVTPDLMRLLGLFIAEGSYHKTPVKTDSPSTRLRERGPGGEGLPSSLCFTFGHDESHFAEFVCDTIRQIFGVECVIIERLEKRIIEVLCNNTVLARLFFELCGAGCAGKYIPGFVYNCSCENIQAFVDGVVDGDGRRHPTGQVSLKMANRNVIYGMRLLIASLGCIGVARPFDKVSNRKPTFLLQWNPEAGYRRHLTTEDHLLLPLKAIETREYDGLVHNLEVAEHNSYVTDIAVHNCELYVATRKRTDRDPKKDGNHHLVALAKNQVGYKNLMKLVTLASLEGFYYKPRVDKELLAQYSEGLIICSACMGGELAQAIMNNGESIEPAKSVAAWYREVFGDDFYLEVQGHHAKGQWDVNEAVKRISRATGIKMVATNDSHYLRAEDAGAHDVLICIQTGTTVEDPKRMKYEPREFYLKEYDEMMGEFETFAPDAIENTLEIAGKCNLEIEMGRAPLPDVNLDEGKDAQQTMERLCWEGLDRRLPRHTNIHKDRLIYELDIIQKTGFAQYFLIVMDISNYSRGSGIFFGVRGSAAGSLASYCLGITDLDPIEYNLTFERFLNPERISMPDVDMDFQDDRRADVIQHVTEKYGRDQVAYITTFGTLGAKAALRDAGRALAIPLPDVDRVAKMVPALPLGLSIKQAMHGHPEKGYGGNPDMVAEYDNNPVMTKLIDTAQRIEGIARNESVHAAGIMIADRPLVEYTPLKRTTDGSLVTQYPHASLEAIGLLKMDFLGLSNLTILARAVKLITETRGETVDVWNIPLTGDDPRAQKAYEMLARGETTGVFQLESQGMRKYIVDLKPNSVKELAAMVALYRPGPMAHIPRFIRCKFNPDTIQYAYPSLEPILKETYGVIVYQDQVLKIVQAIAGFSLGQADLLRRAMGKKKASEMEKQRENFLKGAAEKGVGKKVAEQIFGEIEPFAGYAFNGAHAACYAMVAYQTAYLKANYPAEYLAALMGAYIDNSE